MTAPDTKDVWLPTRRSLLSRLRNWQDYTSWEEFYKGYGPLIRRAAHREGLNDEEAKDALQDTMKLAAMKLPGFRYDPAIGSFKSWLRKLAHLCIKKQLAKRPPVRIPSAQPAHSRAAGPASLLDGLPGNEAADFERYWETEWEQSLWKVALIRVKRQVKPKVFQIYDLYVSKEWPVQEVAHALNVSVATIYVTKHRVGMMLRREIARLRRKDEA